MKVKQIQWEKVARFGRIWGEVGNPDPESGISLHFYIQHWDERYKSRANKWSLDAFTNLGEKGMEGCDQDLGNYDTLQAAQNAAQKFLEKCVQSLIED